MPASRRLRTASIEEVVLLKLLGKILLFLLAVGAALAALQQEAGPRYISVYDTDEDEMPY